jgi:hypothetical protein
MKSFLEDLEVRLNDLRPYARQEFQKAVPSSVPGLDDSAYKKYIFDYERAPYIEKRGMDRARQIVFSIPPEAYPDPDIFLFACLQRMELFLYEQVRPAEVSRDVDESRSLMYKTGIKKVIRVVSGRLGPVVAGTWEFRRGLLDIVEGELLRRELRLGNDAALGAVDDLAAVEETLLALAPQDLLDFRSAGDLEVWVVGRCGAPAKRLVELAKKNR